MRIASQSRNITTRITPATRGAQRLQRRPHQGLDDQPARRRPAERQHQQVAQPGADEEHAGVDQQVIRKEDGPPPRGTPATTDVGHHGRAETRRREHIGDQPDHQAGDRGQPRRLAHGQQQQHQHEEVRLAATFDQRRPEVELQQQQQRHHRPETQAGRPAAAAAPVDDARRHQGRPGAGRGAGGGRRGGPQNQHVGHVAGIGEWHDAVDPLESLGIGARAGDPPHHDAARDRRRRPRRCRRRSPSPANRAARRRAVPARRGRGRCPARASAARGPAVGRDGRRGKIGIGPGEGAARMRRHAPDLTRPAHRR